MNFKSTSLFIMFAHVLLGALCKFAPPLFVCYYLGFILWGIYTVLKTGDRDHCAAKYGLYVMGMEIVYRMGGISISWELAKYACIGLFICGMFVRRKRSEIQPFLVWLLLLLPAIVLTHTNEGWNDWRKMVLFNLGGPICLAFAGMYFYRRKIDAVQLWGIIRWAILASISLVALLMLGPSASSVDFSSNANFDMSGGFGPNQVSTVLGYFLLLLFFAIWNRKVLTYNRWTDYLLSILLIYRGLLTFSRGGLFAVSITIGVSTIVLWWSSKFFRKQLWKYGVGLVLVGILIMGVFYVANQATGNWLLYRYQGLSTVEVNTDTRGGDKSYLSNREKIAGGEIEMFKEHWLTGVGVGMSQKKRAESGKVYASHTEQTRMLSEHGILGLVAIILLMVVYPINRFLMKQGLLSRQFFLLFFILGTMTMLHAAMRMALPGVVIGFSFALIWPSGEYRIGRYGRRFEPSEALLYQQANHHRSGDH